MKLIRVSSTQTQDTGHFSNEFSEAIVLPKQSQIGLINASLAMSSKSIHITGSNNTFTYKTKGGSTVTARTVTLTPGKYTLQDAMIELHKQMNSVLTYTDAPEAFGWYPELTEDNFLNLIYSQSTNYRPTDEQKDLTGFTASSSAGVYIYTAGGSGSK